MPTTLNRRPWDIVAAAASLSLMGIAAVLVPHEALIAEYTVAYNAVFGIGATLLTYWILIRLWSLARADGGPSGFIAASIVLRLVGGVYLELWNVLVSGRPYQQPLDLTMSVVHITAGALLAFALLNWSRIPDWLGWLLVAQVAMSAIEAATGLMLLGDLPVTAEGLLWTVFLGCLAVVLVTPSDSVGASVKAEAGGI